MHRQRSGRLTARLMAEGGDLPPVSILVPARNEELVIESHESYSDPLSSSDAVQFLLGSNIEFDALFCLVDYLAASALMTLRRKGLHVPGDVSVVGFDGTPDGEQIWPGLTTVVQPTRRMAIAACEAGIAAMWRALTPGMTENALWSHLHATNIAHGGEWIECRLLTSGERTNPWFQECSGRVIQPGDIVAFDTDLIGPNGYCADVSRTWVAGDVRPTDEQRRLYGVALDNLHHNLALVRAGLSLRELTEKSFPLPEEFVARRYSCIIHGVGLADEYPFAVYPQDWQRWGYDGHLEAGMTICIEALIGTERGKECVKLEQQVLVTETGYDLWINGKRVASGIVPDPAGVEVTDFSDLPAEFTRIRIPEQHYAVFTHRDHVAGIRRTMNTIWNDWLPSSRKVSRIGR